MIDARLDITNSLEQKLPLIIEAFVKFYGEEERERIIEKLTEATYVGYLRISDYLTLVCDCEGAVSKEVAKTFFEKIGLEPTDDLTYRFFGSCLTTLSDELKNFYEDYGSDKEYKRKHVLNILKRLFNDEELTPDSEKYQKYCEMVLSYKTAYEEAVKEFDAKTEILDQYNQLYAVFKDFEKKINMKYKQKYLNALSDHLSEEDKKRIDDEYNYNMDCYETLIGFSWNNKCLLDAFSEENDEKLKDPKTNDFYRDSVISDRIKYYKKMGVDLGDDYEDYLESEEARKITPSHEFVNEVLSLRDKLTKEMDTELYSTLPTVLALKEKLGRVGLVSKSDGLVRNVRDGGTCICPNLITNNGQVVVHPIMYIGGATGQDIFDCRIIHECNHIYELSLLDYDGENVRYCSGWDVVEEGIVKTEEEVDNSYDDGTHRDYELLNEIINELLAQDITRTMHEAGIYLYSSPENAKNNGATSYQYAARLVIDFYNEFKPLIIESRKNHNLGILFNRIGEENFMALNDLIHEYLEYFVGFKLYNTIDAIKNGKENDDTRFYMEATRRSNEILERIRSHKIDSSFRL